MNLFPFHRCRGLCCNIIDYAVDSLDLVGDSVRDLCKHLERDSRPVRRHKVVGSHRAKRDEAVVSPRVAHDADAVDVGEHREILVDVAVDAGELDLLAEDGVRILEDA